MDQLKDVLGVGPIEYLMHWRMAVARDELRRRTRSISEIALAVRIQSAIVQHIVHHSGGLFYKTVSGQATLRSRLVW